MSREERIAYAAEEAVRLVRSNIGEPLAMCFDGGGRAMHECSLLSAWSEVARSHCPFATYSYGAPLPPGDTRPPVLGGECARCFAQPPYHERRCMTRRECVR